MASAYARHLRLEVGGDLACLIVLVGRRLDQQVQRFVDLKEAVLLGYVSGM
jgi:hypothetical protein